MERRRRTEGETRKGPWTAEEDEILIKFVNVNGPRDWSSIRSKGLLPRTGKSCRLRWVNKLRPNLKKGCKFTAEEERVVLELQATFGNRWATIASYLPGRTDNDVKNFWSTRQKRLARILGSSSSLKKTKSSSSNNALSMDAHQQPSSSHQVTKSSSNNKVNEESPSTSTRLCSCFCTENPNNLSTMLQCTPTDCINHHPPYTTNIELVNTNLPPQQVTANDINPKAPTYYYNASSSSSCSWHFCLGHYHEQQHPFLPETHDHDHRDLDDGVASYLSMEVGAEPIISGMDDMLAYNPEEAGGIHLHAETTQNYDDRSSEEEDYKKITVPDNIFNDLPPDLFDYLEKIS